MSSGVPARLSGNCAAKCSVRRWARSSFSSADWVWWPPQKMGVTIAPGEMQLTRMPNSDAVAAGGDGDLVCESSWHCCLLVLRGDCRWWWRGSQSARWMEAGMAVRSSSSRTSLVNSAEPR